MRNRPLIDLGLLSVKEEDIPEEDEPEETSEAITSIDASEAIDYWKNNILKDLLIEATYARMEPEDLVKQQLPPSLVAYYAKKKPAKAKDPNTEKLNEIGEQYQFFGIAKEELEKQLIPPELADYFMALRDQFWNETARAFRKVELEGDEIFGKDVAQEVLFLIDFARIVFKLPILKTGGDPDNPEYAPDDQENTETFLASDKYQRLYQELYQTTP